MSWPSRNAIHTVYLIEGPDALYVGVTGRTPEHRYAQHISATRCGWKHDLYDAMRKHGLGAFKVSLFAQARNYERGRETEKDVIEQFVRAGQRLYNSNRDLKQARAHATRLAHPHFFPRLASKLAQSEARA